MPIYFCISLSADSFNSCRLEHDNGEKLLNDVALPLIENISARIHDSFAMIDTHVNQQALRIQRTLRPKIQQNLPIESIAPKARGFTLPSAYEDRLHAPANLIIYPRLVETSRLHIQLTNLLLQMSMMTADENSISAGLPLAIVP